MTDQQSGFLLFSSNQRPSSFTFVNKLKHSFAFPIINLTFEMNGLCEIGSKSKRLMWSLSDAHIHTNKHTHIYTYKC